MKRIMRSIIATSVTTLGLGGLAALPASASTVKAEVGTPVLNTTALHLGISLGGDDTKKDDNQKDDTKKDDKQSAGASLCDSPSPNTTMAAPAAAISITLTSPSPES